MNAVDGNMAGIIIGGNVLKTVFDSSGNDLSTTDSFLSPTTWLNKIFSGDGEVNEQLLKATLENMT